MNADYKYYILKNEGFSYNLLYIKANKTQTSYVYSDGHTLKIETYYGNELANYSWFKTQYREIEKEELALLL